MVRCSVLMLVGRLRDGRVRTFFFFLGYGRRRAWRFMVWPTRWTPSRFDPCKPGWFDVGRLVCGLFTVRSRLQLRCGLCTVVLATSWSAGFAWVPSRCCSGPYSRMLFE